MYELIDSLIEQNVLCFDYEAKLGEPTIRLFHLMNCEYRKQTGSVLDEYWIPCESWSWQFGFKAFFFGYKLKTYCGSYLEYYKGKDAYLAIAQGDHTHKDECLVIGVDKAKENSGMLGSF